MLKKSFLLATLAALALGSTALAQNAPVAPSPIKRTVVGKVEVPGSNYETITAIVEIAPGFKAGRHLHPGLVFAQVTEGEFWLAPDGKPEKVYKNGETLTLSTKEIHNEGNPSADKWVKLVATYVVEKGQPLVQPVK